MPAAGDPPTIVAAATADRDLVATVLAEAFSTDPHVIGLLPSGDIGAGLTRLFCAEFDETMAAGGHAYLALDSAAGADGTALGAALWHAPGARVPRGTALRSVPSHVRTFRRRILDAARSHHEFELHRPTAPHWYLKAVGTTQVARGRGVGSALLRERLRVVDREGTGAYLESSSRANVGIYERFGFVERGPIRAYGTSAAIAMWRPAADAAL